MKLITIRICRILILIMISLFTYAEIKVDELTKKVNLYYGIGEYTRKNHRGLTEYHIKNKTLINQKKIRCKFIKAQEIPYKRYAIEVNDCSFLGLFHEIKSPDTSTIVIFDKAYYTKRFLNFTKGKIFTVNDIVSTPDKKIAIHF